MRRRLAEQPRVVIAQMVLVAALVLGGVAVGTRLAEERDGASTAAADALARSRSQALMDRRALGEAAAERERLRARIARAGRRARALRRRNRALRGSLERTRRRLARARRR